MDFKPPDNAGTKAAPYNDFAMPLRFPQGRSTEPSNISPLIRENTNSRVPVQDRLGNSMGGNANNRGDNFRSRGGNNRNFHNNQHFNNGPNQPWRNNFNRKRNMDDDRDRDREPNVKRWKRNNKNQNNMPYQRTSQNPAQNRLNNIRSRFSDCGETLSYKDDMSSACASEINETPSESLTFHVDNKQIEEDEPTDITVEVVNNQPAVEEPPVEEPSTKFKMVLTPKLQNSIKMIQEKRKEKQVIIPYPVKPNITMMSTHERFSLL